MANTHDNISIPLELALDESIDLKAKGLLIFT